MDQINKAAVTPEPTQSERKAYETPALTDLGSFAELTQGSFVNTGVDNVTYS
jgi:hypothetical protein